MISVVALAAFSIGVAFNVFDHVHDWLERTSPVATDNVVAILMILAATFAVFAVRALKRAEHEGELREETERRYRAMVEQVPSVSYQWDPSARAGQVATVYVSPQIERLLGYSPEEWVSSPTFWIERLHSDDRARVISASERSDRSGAPFRQDYRMISKDGRIVWIRDESTLVSTDRRTRTTHVQGVMYDITEQKQAEERIQEAENRYRTMVERVPAVAYTWDSADGVGEAPLLYISPQIERLLGFTAAEWMSDPALWSRCAHPDDRASILERWVDAAGRGETFMGEYRLRTADGRWIWVRDEAVPVATGSRGRPIYQGVMFDITQQKHAEQRYRRLVSELPVVTYLTDGMDPNGDHPMPYVSPGIEQLTGRPAAEWMTRPQTWAEMIHPDDRSRVLELDRDTDRSGERFEVEYRFLRDNGEVVWVRDTAVLVDRDGAWPVWQGVIEDITARRQTETRLREAEERFRALVEQIPALTYIEDPSGNLLYMSPQVETLLGFRVDEYDSGPTSWRDQLHPEDRDRVLASDAAVDTDQWVEEYRTIAKDGRIVWVHNEAVLLRDDEGHPRFWLGVIVDTTEHMEAEERLRVAQDRYRYLVERLPTTVYVDVADDQSTAVYISPQYEALTGYSPDERLSDPGLWLRMLHEEDRDRVLAESRRTNATGDPFDIEYRVETKDRRTVWLHDLAYIVEGQDGSPCWQGVLTDITERKLAEEAISRRDEILQAVGHAAERFLGASSWTDAIGDVLAHLGRAGDASRAAVYRRELDEEGRDGIVLVEEWTAPGVEALAEQIGDRLVAFDDVGLSRWSEVFASGEIINSLTVDLPASERATLEHVDVQTIVAIPIVSGGEWWGHLVYDQTKQARVWQQSEVDALRVVANTLGAAVGREKAARILSQTEARYQTLIEQMVEQIPAITYIDECRDVGDARMWPNVYISPQVETILGYSPREWRDNLALRASLIHPDDLADSLDADRRHFESGEPLAREIRLKAKDGMFHWLRDEAIIVRDEAGQPLWSQGILLDITERKSAEGHLHEAEERYRSLIETIPAATYIDTVEAVSQGVFMSPQVEAIFGYTPEEWLRRPELWEQGVHPDDLPEVAERIERLNREGIPFDAEYRFRRPDGRTIWVHDQAVVIRDEHGDPRFCQGVMFDITERREAEEQLREAEERFRAIVEHVPAGIYLDLPDTSMQTMYASPQLQDITGIPTEDWTSNPEAWVEVLHEEDREEVLGRYLASIAAQEPWSAEYRLQRHDGRIIWVHDETTLIRDEGGRDAMLLGVISDITERKLAEHALRESEQREREAAERLRVLDEMKNTFLAAVSHELRSPLTAILGLALTLERSEMAENDRNDLLERLAANARKLDRLLKDLLDIDRLNRGIVEPQYRVTDVGALARRTVESLDALADRSIMAFADPVVLSVDPAKVERIVENLLMNAARHTAADSTIWLRVRSDGAGVLIAVEDDGAGVPEELREAIFEPFRQGPTSSPHAPGTGIGLSLVGRFAELHGGRAWVEERDGGGASFRVFLPAGPMKDAESLASRTDIPLDGSPSDDGHAEAG